MSERLSPSFWWSTDFRPSLPTTNVPWPALEGLHVGLDELGYNEGKDFLIEYRFAEGAAERFPGLAAELVGLSVDVIVTWGTPATLAALKATSSIPILMSAGDPIGAGLVASLARPGGNVTGLSSQTAGGEEKRLELLKELRPTLSTHRVDTRGDTRELKLFWR